MLGFGPISSSPLSGLLSGRTVLLAALLDSTSSLTVDSLHRKRSVAASISEEAVLSAAISRALGLAATVNEGYDVVALLRKQKKVAANIAQLETLDIVIARSRATASTVAQNFNVAAALLRARGISADIDQTLTMSIEIMVGTAIYLAAAIDAALTLNVSLTRNRGMKVLIDQLEGTVTSLLRARKMSAGITELEAVNAKVGRTLQLIVTLAESSSVNAALARRRAQSVSIAEVFVLDETDLIRLKAVATLINEATAMEVGKLARKRGLHALIEEVETYSASLRRMREMGVAVVQQSTLTADMKRVRSVITSIASIQGLTTSTLRRIRSLAADVATVLGMTVTIRIFNVEPGVFQLTMSWYEHVNLGNGVFDQVLKSETFEVRRESEQIVFDIGTAPEIVFEVPAGEPLPQEIIDALVNGHQIPHIP
jgi:hypothetical protein